MCFNAWVIEDHREMPLYDNSQCWALEQPPCTPPAQIAHQLHYNTIIGNCEHATLNLSVCVCVYIYLHALVGQTTNNYSFDMQLVN